jgi:hypothetical protein
VVAATAGAVWVTPLVEPAVVLARVEARAVPVARVDAARVEAVTVMVAVELSGRRRRARKVARRTRVTSVERAVGDQLPSRAAQHGWKVWRWSRRGS